MWWDKKGSQIYSVTGAIKISRLKIDNESNRRNMVQQEASLKFCMGNRRFLAEKGSSLISVYTRRFKFNEKNLFVCLKNKVLSK